MRKFALTALLGLALVGCADSNGVNAINFTIDDLVDTWISTEWTLSHPELGPETRDLFAEGARLTVIFSADGTFTENTTQIGVADDPGSGTFSVEGSNVTMLKSGQLGSGFMITSGGDALRSGETNPNQIVMRREADISSR